MGIILKLIQGADELNLNSGRYCADPNFTPPSTQVRSTLARGGKLVEREAEPRQFNFSIHVDGAASTSEAERALSNIQSFLDRAGDENNPVYLAYRSFDDYDFEPNWGGGVGLYSRYEIIEGRVDGSRAYVGLQTANSLIDVPVTVMIKPWKINRLLELRTSKGGIFEDYIGSGTGWAKGVRIPEATTNEHVNPIFGNTTSPETGWNAGSAVRYHSVRNTLGEDNDGVLFGITALRLASNSSSNNTFTDTITLATGTWTLSYYVRRIDGADVDSNDMQVYYDTTARSTTFDDLGNGWFRASASVSGTNAADLTGIVIKSGRTIYLAGGQAENKAYFTPLCHGDLFGNAWDGTAHGGTPGTDSSTRTAALLQAGRLLPGEGTIRIVWESDYSDAHPSDMQMFEIGGGTGWGAHYDVANNRYEFSDGTNTINASTTLAAGDKVVLHFVYEPGSLKVYENGSEIGTGSTYTPPISNAFFNNLGLGYAPLTVGSTNAPGSHSGGIYYDFSTFEQAMDATQVSADYDQCVQQLTDGEYVSRIPYWWIDSGGELDNADDGTSQNWGILGQVPGDAPADIFLRGDTTGAAANDDYYLAFSDFPVRGFKDLEFLSYIPGSPPDVVNVTTSDTTIATVTWTEHESLLMAGMEVTAFLRADEDGADNIDLRIGVDPGGGTYYYSDYEDSDWIASGTTQSIDSAPFIDILKEPVFFDDFVVGNYDFSVSIRVQGKRPTGSGNFNLYYMQVIPRPLMRIVNISSAGVTADYVYSRGRLFEADSVAAAIEFGYEIRGDTPKILPNRMNAIFSYVGKEGNESISTDSVNLAVFIIPRSHLL